MPRIVRILFAVDIALVLLDLGNLAIGQPSSKVTSFVSLGGESNLPTWYSSIQLFLIALLLALFAVHSDRRDRASWGLFVPAAIFAALSLDEVAQLHEWIGHKIDFLLPGGSREGTALSETGAWAILLGPLFLAGMIYLGARLGSYFQGRRPIAIRYIVGLIVFVGSAGGLETLANFSPEEGLLAVVQVSLEELGEMVGGTILFWATLELMASHGIVMPLRVNGGIE